MIRSIAECSNAIFSCPRIYPCVEGVLEWSIEQHVTSKTPIGHIHLSAKCLEPYNYTSSPNSISKPDAIYLACDQIPEDRDCKLVKSIHTKFAEDFVKNILVRSVWKSLRVYNIDQAYLDPNDLNLSINRFFVDEIFSRSDENSIACNPVLQYHELSSKDRGGGGVPSNQILREAAVIHGSYEYSVEEGSILQSGVHELTVLFTPSNTKKYFQVAKTIILNVHKYRPVLRWSKYPIILNTNVAISRADVSAVCVNDCSDEDGFVVYTPPIGGYYSEPGWQTLTAKFVPHPHCTHNVQESEEICIRVFVRERIVPEITWQQFPSPITFGKLILASIHLNATSLVPGNFIYNVKPTDRPPVGSLPITAKFIPTDLFIYLEVEVTQNLLVTGKPPKISWKTPAPIIYGAALSADELSAVCTEIDPATFLEMEGTMEYKPALGTVLSAGQHNLTAVFTPASFQPENNSALHKHEYTPATVTMSISVLKSSPDLCWVETASIYENEIFSNSFLRENLSCEVDGNFYTAPYKDGDRVCMPGMQEDTKVILSVMFVPLDVDNYNSVSIDAVLTIKPRIAACVLWPLPVSITYGEELSATKHLAATFLKPGKLTKAIVSAVNAERSRDSSDSDNFRFPANFEFSSIQFHASIDKVLSRFVHGGNSERCSKITNRIHSASYSVLSISTAEVEAIRTFAGSFTNTVIKTAVWNSLVVGGYTQFSPPAGTKLGAGNALIQLSFTPMDTVRYVSFTHERTLKVERYKPTISWGGSVQCSQKSFSQGSHNHSQGSHNHSQGSHNHSQGSHNHSQGSHNHSQGSHNHSQGNHSLTLYCHELLHEEKHFSPAVLEANISGRFVYCPPIGTAFSEAGSYGVECRFVPADTANFDEMYFTFPTIVLPQLSPRIEWVSPQYLTYTETVSELNLGAVACCCNGSGYDDADDKNETEKVIPGKFSYNVNSGQLFPAGVHTCVATFTPTDTVKYSSSCAMMELVVSKMSTSVIWATPKEVFVHEKLSLEHHLTAYSVENVPGFFTYHPKSAGDTITEAGYHKLSVTFTPNDTDNYNEIHSFVYVRVLPLLLPEIRWDFPRKLQHGTCITQEMLSSMKCVDLTNEAYPVEVPGVFELSAERIVVEQHRLTVGQRVRIRPLAISEIIRLQSGADSASNSSRPTPIFLGWPERYNKYVGKLATIVFLQVNDGMATIEMCVDREHLLVRNELVTEPPKVQHMKIDFHCGAILKMGEYKISVRFVPDYSPPYAPQQLTIHVHVGEVRPELKWKNPLPAITVGEALYSQQLCAEVIDDKVKGEFTYIPPWGSRFSKPGTYKLQAIFHPDKNFAFFGPSEIHNFLLVKEKASSSSPPRFPGKSPEQALHSKPHFDGSQGRDMKSNKSSYRNIINAEKFEEEYESHILALGQNTGQNTERNLLSYGSSLDSNSFIDSRDLVGAKENASVENASVEPVQQGDSIRHRATPIFEDPQDLLVYYGIRKTPSQETSTEINTISAIDLEDSRDAEVFDFNANRLVYARPVTAAAYAALMVLDEGIQEGAQTALSNTDSSFEEPKVGTFMGDAIISIIDDKGDVWTDQIKSKAVGPPVTGAEEDNSCDLPNTAQVLNHTDAVKAQIDIRFHPRFSRLQRWIVGKGNADDSGDSDNETSELIKKISSVSVEQKEVDRASLYLITPDKVEEIERRLANCSPLLTEDTIEMSDFFRSQCGLGRVAARRAAVYAMLQDIQTPRKLARLWARVGSSSDRTDYSSGPFVGSANNPELSKEKEDDDNYFKIQWIVKLLRVDETDAEEIDSQLTSVAMSQGISIFSSKDLVDKNKTDSAAKIDMIRSIMKSLSSNEASAQVKYFSAIPSDPHFNTVLQVSDNRKHTRKFYSFKKGWNSVTS